MEPSKDFKIPELHARMINSCRRRNRRCSKVHSRRTPPARSIVFVFATTGPVRRGSGTREPTYIKEWSRKGASHVQISTLMDASCMFFRHMIYYWLDRVHNGESGQESFPWSKRADVLKEEIRVLYVTSRCVGRGLHFPATWQRFPSHAGTLEALQPRYICACCLRVGIACS